MKRYGKRVGVGFALLVTLCAGHRSFGQTAPDLTLSQTQGVTESAFFYLGPTGMKGWMYWYNLTDVARQILVTEVRTNTPANGVMAYHDVILGIGGNTFTNDARAAFIDAVTDAEAGDGQLDLTVFRPSDGVTNTLSLQLGITNAPLASTTPYGCAKAEAILTNYCEYVYENGPTGTPTVEFSLWAMLGSDNPRYVSWATNYIKNVSYASRTNLTIYVPDPGLRAWHIGYQLVTLAQYYMYTESQGTPDDSILPAMTNAALYRAMGQDYRGHVSHTFAFPQNNGGMLHGSLPSYGPVNASTLVGLYGLILARECGVSHPEVDAAIEKSAEFYKAHVGLGTINYGFNPPVSGVVDSNGRMGVAAHIFRALGDVETAKWFAMMTSTYGWRDWGHTGNEFNHAWGPLAANIGGSNLVNYIHTNLDNRGSPYHQVSINMRRQPEGWFQSQGQAGQGNGRSGGHATGSYALQMAIPKGTLEVVGKGYSTNFWLTAEEMDQVAFAFTYEGSGASVADLDTPTLMNNLSNFCPKVSNKVADELTARLAADPTIRTNLMDMVVNDSVLDMARVAALRALDDEGRTNATVKASVDTWYAPTNGYVLMYGALNYNIEDKASQLAVLEAIAQLDGNKTFDNLLVGDLARSIYVMSTNGWSEAEIDTYFGAVDKILNPDAAGSWFIGGQNIKNWPADVLAGYADYLLRVSERVGLTYNAPEIIATKPFGEGLYTWMVRSDYMAHGPYLDTSSHWNKYGRKALVYTNQIRRLGAVSFPYERWIYSDRFLDIYAKQSDPDLIWFRDQIADNIDADYPGATTNDLRGVMATSTELPLFRAVMLDKIVNAVGDTNAFEDIVQYVGSKAPVVGTDWRLYRGAIELGTNATYSTDQQWLDALPDAVAGNDQVRIAGILHVLAGRDVAAARTNAEPFLIHENDFVTIGALDVYRAVGQADDLLMLFNQFMTNTYTVTDGVVTFDTTYKLNAYWDAIHAIVERDSPISSTIANQIAAAFNAVTSGGTDMTGIAVEGVPKAEPLSILNPTNSSVDKIYNDYVVGPIGILGLFPGTDCDQALQNIQDNIGEDRYWGRGPKFAAAEAVMRQHTIPEIVAIQSSGGTNSWSDREAIVYLMMEHLQGKVAITNQLNLLKDIGYNGKNLQSDGGGWLFEEYQMELDRKRGLEEEGAVHYFYVK